MFLLLLFSGAGVAMATRLPDNRATEAKWRR
jgi:hypothetical protein